MHQLKEHLDVTAQHRSGLLLIDGKDCTVHMNPCFLSRIEYNGDKRNKKDTTKTTT